MFKKFKILSIKIYNFEIKNLTGLILIKWYLILFKTF